jgi:hypothetical protein
MSYIKSIREKLVLALPLAMLLNFSLFVQTGYAAGKVKIPGGIGPTYDSPANSTVMKMLNTFLGLCVLGCVAFFIWGIVSWVKSTGGMRDVGTSHPLVKSAAAAVAIGIIFSVNGFVTGWSNFVIS